MYDATTTNEPPPAAEEAVAAVCDRRHNSALSSSPAKVEEAAAGRAVPLSPATGNGHSPTAGRGLPALPPFPNANQPTAGRGLPAVPLIAASSEALPAAGESMGTTRRERILAAITAQFQDISGLGLEALTASARFAELGLDSLVLYQASRILQERFGLAIAFRRLQEDLSSLGDLANFIDKSLAPEPETPRAEAAPAPQAAAAPAAEAPDAGDAPQNSSEAGTPRGGVRTAQRAVPTKASEGFCRAPDAGESVILPLAAPQRELWLASQAGRDASCSFNQVFAIHLAGQPGADLMVGILQNWLTGTTPCGRRSRPTAPVKGSRRAGR